MADFYSIGMSCANCGKPLEARSSVTTSSFSIVGLRDLEYRHEDGTIECVIIRKPTAFDGWRATTAFEAAQALAWAKHDAEIEAD